METLGDTLKQRNALDLLSAIKINIEHLMRDDSFVRGSPYLGDVLYWIVRQQQVWQREHDMLQGEL